MSSLAFMNIGAQELIFIVLIILLLFGARKLPELARGMRQAVKEFQKGKDESDEQLHSAEKSDTETTKSDVKPAQATGSRSADQSTRSVTAPKPNEAVTPGDKTDQV